MSALATQTKETATLVHWLSAVDDGVIAKVGRELRGIGPTGEWLREETQRKRLHLYYRTGEPAWMSIDTMVGFARGAMRAVFEDSDHNAISAAWRARRSV